MSMEGGDPGAKRPRLAHSSSHIFTSSLPVPPGSGNSAPPPPPAHPPLSHLSPHPVRPSHYPEPRPPSHPYPPHALPLPPATSSFRDPTASALDGRSLPLPVSGPPPPSPASVPPAFPSARYGSAPVTTYPTRSYSVDSAHIRGPGTPTQSVPPEGPRRSSTVPGAPEENHPPMDHAGHPPAYPVLDHHINGSVHNAYSMGVQHDPYGSGPVGHSQGYPPTPVSQYMQPNMYGPQGAFIHPARRKQVRATQACNNCRSRKQKCDEQRPKCSSCKEAGTDCQYRDVPLPKQERSMVELMDRVQQMIEAVQSSTGAITDIQHRIARVEKQLGVEGSGPVPPPAVPARPHSMSPTVADYEEMKDIEKSEDEEDPTKAVLSTTENTIIPTRVHTEPEHPSVSTASGIMSESPDEEGEITLPTDHTTGAHYLRDWNSISILYENSGVANANYVMEEEQKRGLLRPYGRGEGQDISDGVHDRQQGLGSPANSSQSDDTVSIPSPPQEGFYGTGLPASPPTEPRRSDWPGPQISGLNPDGTMNLDSSTVRRLHQSYLDHIQILHPFLDKNRLQKMVEYFIKRHSMTPVSRSPFAVSSVPAIPSVPPIPGVPEPASGNALKRKRSQAPTSVAFQHAQSPESGFLIPNKKLPERSMGNCIVLLVLALGKICEHKEPLPGVPKAPEQRHQTDGSPKALQIESPPATIRPSPASSSSTATNVSSPPNEFGRYGSRSRRSSVDGSTPADLGPKNLDLIPGLAYYAYASDILGNNNGGNDLAHGQARILAGLYMGQLARVLESWNWIYHACITCRMLIEKDRSLYFRKDRELRKGKPRREDPYNPKEGQIALTINLYWTCLQLESDIRAELDKLPDSEISKYEQDMGFPSYVLDEMPVEQPDFEVTLIMLYYSAQIHLRKILNRAHLALYSKKKVKKGTTTKLSWRDVEASSIWEGLREWRQTLPPPLQWHDDDPPAKDINAARIRGKYYGAAYIITRPFIQYALESMEPHPTLLQEVIDLQDSPLEMPQMPAGRNLSSNQQGMSPDAERLKLILRACKACVYAAIRSTLAFDGLLPDRWIVTNIFGTAHAQFGNMLVLTAVHRSWLRNLVPRWQLDELLNRTIGVLRTLAPISPTMVCNIMVLENTQKILEGKRIESTDSNENSFSAQ